MNPFRAPGPLLPTRLHLDRDRELQLDWSDGVKSVFPLSTLRSHCPCASCKVFREDQSSRKSMLTILPGNYAGKLTATTAELVGNYALRIDWSDGHASGIYSFEYLASLRNASQPVGPSAEGRDSPVSR